MSPGNSSPVPLLAGFIAGAALQIQQPVLGFGLHYALLTILAGLLLLIQAILTVRSWQRQSSQGTPPNTTGQPTEKAGWAKFFLAFLVAVALGFGLTGWRAVVFSATALSPGFEGRDVDVTGRIDGLPAIGTDGVRFRLAVESAAIDGLPVQLPPVIQLGWYAGFGSRDTTVLDMDTQAAENPLALQRQPQPVRAGERWRMTVRLKQPHGSSNPHGFDYELWLWGQGIQATGYVRAGVNNTPPKRVDKAGWSHLWAQARQSVRDAIEVQVPDSQRAGIIAALVVGDQKAIGREDWDVFRLTGVAHLMSISGLHITMFAWLAALVIAALWRASVGLSPRLCLWLPAGQAGAVGGLALALLYALFSGWGVPAQRTVWMLAVVVGLQLGNRRWPWPIVWLLAMAVVVLADPWALMQAGFWLSFVAVAVLFATDLGAARAGNPGLAARFDTQTATELETSSSAGDAKPSISQVLLISPLQTLGHHLAVAARQQWLITLALAPLTLLLFNQMSLVSLLANAVAIPLVTLFITPLAIAGTAWPLLWDAAALAIGWLMAFLQFLAQWPLASISVAAAPLGYALAAMVGALLLVLQLPWHWRFMGLPLLLPVLLWQPARPAQGQFDLLAADIGQGNAVLIRTRSHALLYDTGPRFSDTSDAGSRVLVPLLRALGEKIDLLVLSHRDSDHIGGAAAVLAMQPQAGLLSSIEAGHVLQQTRLAQRCVAGQRWQWDGVAFELLHPAAADYDNSRAKSNALSCVLKITALDGTGALLAGDIEAAQELRLASEETIAGLLKSDVLLVPHHGSKTSSTPAFLAAVQPQWAIVQAGYRNSYRHPAPAVVERYTERNITLLRSDTCGAVHWSSIRKEAATCQRNEAARYWQYSVKP